MKNKEIRPDERSYLEQSFDETFDELAEAALFNTSLLIWCSPLTLFTIAGGIFAFFGEALLPKIIFAVGIAAAVCAILSLVFSLFFYFIVEKGKPKRVSSFLSKVLLTTYIIASLMAIWGFFYTLDLVKQFVS